MKYEKELKTRYSKCLQAFDVRGQAHVLRWWDELSVEQQDELLTQLESIPWELLDGVIPTHVLREPRQAASSEWSPPVVYPHVPDSGRIQAYEEARRRGVQILRDGRVAAFTVAGGQGTRLGFDGPKGAVIVTPVGERSLFGLFADSVWAARRRYRAAIPWYIMTSPANHDATADYFSSHGFFDLPEEDVRLFQQGMLPAFDFQGRLLLQEKHRLAMAPDGHGGSLKALSASGAMDDMRRRGVKVISYFQVDNPLVKPFDPLFIGLHAAADSEASTKVARKIQDLERVGNVCLKDGHVAVIEYSEFPESLARARNPDGSRRFDFGNLAIHLLNVDFIDRIAGRSFQLPFRRAVKKVAFVDESGRCVEPDEPNAVKLETFVFDALPLAERSLLLEVDRSEEFSPVKNATGVDSLETSRRDQVRRARRWLEKAGVTVPRGSEGQPAVEVIISPRFALDAEDVAARREELPSLHEGAGLLIDTPLN